MLILPFQTRFAPRSAPLVTLALILASVLVFFVAQARDERAFERAFDYYEQSDLPRIELAHYQDWLARQADAREQLGELQDALRAHDIAHALTLMQGDDEFAQALHELRAVPPDDPEFLTWRDQRNRFDALLQSPTADAFALARDLAQPWRFITYQFMHGDLGHLLGNAVVLLLAGSFAEPALGRLRFLAGFLLSGAAAGALHLALSDAPVIGASGAIAGTMAMVAVLYRLQRVPVFVWLLFYFDTARIPALWLLPVWIANELWQWLAASEESIAYAAHVGGLLFGAAFALIARPAAGKPVPAEFESPTGQRARLQLQRAEQAAGRLDIAQAARLYAELAAQYPMRSDYAAASFHLAALGHDDEALRRATERVLAAPPARIGAALRRAYLRMTNPNMRTLLAFDARLRLVRALARAGEDTAALELIDDLLADESIRTGHARELAECLQALLRDYASSNRPQAAGALRRRLAERFASSQKEGVGLP
mgnify:CR=1 FL=1